MSKKTIYSTIAILVALIIILLIASKKGILGKKEEGKEVEVALLEELTIIETVSATGKIQPETEIKISSEVSGEIIDLPIKEGQTVKKGDLLVRVNPYLYESGTNRSKASLSNSQSMLSQVDAQLKEAKANYERNKILFEKDIISKSEWEKIISLYEVAVANKESAYYNVESAKATLKEAQENLRRTTIYAPVDGTISKLSAELGEVVLGTQQMAGTEILRVANLNNMEVEVDINENDIVKVNLGNTAHIEVDAYPKKQFKGEVTSISNSANTMTTDQVTNFKVKIRLLKESYKDLIQDKPLNYSPFRPGMTATVDIITHKKDNIIAVPISAIVIKTDTIPNKETIKKTTSKKEEKWECVFVKSDNKVKLRVIQTGIQDDTNIEIISGLKKGETIITGPYTTITKILEPDDLIYIKQEKP